MRTMIQIDLIYSFLEFIYAMLIIFLVSFFLYFKRGGKSEFLLTYLAAGAIVFQICHLLKTLSLDIGIAFGLFAIFSLIRYRTNPLSVREITYLFLVVGIAALDGLITDQPFYAILIWDSLLIGTIVIGEKVLSKHKVKTKRVVYEKIELLEEDRYEELLSDLRKRLSINQITKVKIGEVNFFRKTSVLMVYFEDERDNNY